MYPRDQKILVVDDEVVRRSLIETILADEEFTVVAVGEGLAALRAAATDDFALIVAAVDLPGALDGPTTVRQIRLRRPGTRALFVADGAVLPSWRDPDRDDVIADPFHRRDLVGCVFEILHRRPVDLPPGLSRAPGASLSVS
jgi:CheY-like chemotaxis protein